MLDGEVAACHDLSEGGLAVAAAEMCIAGRLGAHVERPEGVDAATWWFAESMGRLLVEVPQSDLGSFLKRFDGDAEVVGTVTDEARLRLGDDEVDLDALVAAHTGGR